jgi:hypothetical protein
VDEGEWETDEAAWDEGFRADLLRRLLQQLPNLIDIDIDLVSQRQDDVFNDLASRKDLKKLSVCGEHGYPLSAGRIAKLLSNLPNLEALGLAFVERTQTEPESAGSDLLKVIASMRYLERLYLAEVSCVDRSWAVPFASGGLYLLTLDQCENLDQAGLEAMLAVHADVLRHLKLVCVPANARKRQLAEGLRYDWLSLESLCITGIPASEEFLRRFSTSPIEFLEVTPTPLPPIFFRAWGIIYTASDRRFSCDRLGIAPISTRGSSPRSSKSCCSRLKFLS